MPLLAPLWAFVWRMVSKILVCLVMTPVIFQTGNNTSMWRVVTLLEAHKEHTQWYTASLDTLSQSHLGYWDSLWDYFQSNYKRWNRWNRVVLAAKMVLAGNTFFHFCQSAAMYLNTIAVFIILCFFQYVWYDFNFFWLHYWKITCQSTTPI